jgi:hypothetical protein
VLTGKENDIIVADFDIHDNGTEEYKKYEAEFGTIKTLKQNTPSGGFHLFFKYNSSNPDDQFLIDNYLKNKTKYREKGIDIRSNGGYVIIAPSEYDNGKYEFANNEEMLAMPTTFINWLLLGTDSTNVAPLGKNN